MDVHIVSVAFSMRSIQKKNKSMSTNQIDQSVPYLNNDNRSSHNMLHSLLSLNS